jgi:hypothetical protein
MRTLFCQLLFIVLLKIGMQSYLFAQSDLINFQSQLRIPGSQTVTDLWGYVDQETSIEYMLVGSVDNLNIVDVTDPIRPRLVSQVPDVLAFDMKVWQNYVYVVDGSPFGTAVIIDIDDPEDPVVVGSFPAAHNIFIADNGFMVTEWFELRIFDLNPDPLNPKLVFSKGAQGHDAAVIGDRLFDFHGPKAHSSMTFLHHRAPLCLAWSKASA